MADINDVNNGDSGLVARTKINDNDNAINIQSNNHIADTANPHSVTKTQVGLSNVANSDTTTTSNITDSTDKRFVTDAESTVIDNASGVNTGDQTITLTGDVTGSGGGSFVATISNDSVTNAKTAEVATGSVKARITAGAGDSEDIDIDTTFKTALNLSSGDVGLGNVDNTSDSDKPVSTATQTALDDKVDENVAITPATNTKITYDAKGLVTSSAASTTADINDSTDRRYVTDSESTVIDNTSGTNTGDQTITLTGGVTGSGTGSFPTTVVTNANLTGEVTSVGNAATLDNNAVTGKVLTGLSSTPGTVAAADSILVAMGKLDGNVNALNSAIVLQGNWDASAGTFPGGGTAQAGYLYIISVSGTVDSVSFDVGDRITAITDNASTTTFAGNWFKEDYTDQVQSVHGRTGAVASVNGDYTASQVTNVPAGAISAITAQAAINELDTEKEPSFTKNTAFNKNFGTGATDVTTGNDSRLSDSRTCDNTFDSAATSKTNLSLVKADVGLGNVANVDTTTTANITDSSNKRFLTDAQESLVDNSIQKDGSVAMTGAFDEKHGADIASAATTDLETATGNTVDVTGTTSITAITLLGGNQRKVRFTGILTLTNGASLELPTAANITTAVGDYAVFTGYAAGLVRVSSYERADGTPLVGGGSGDTAFESSFDATTSWGTASAGLYTITITAVTHGKGTNVTNVLLYETVGGDSEKVIPNEILIDNTTGDVDFNVTETPNGRFAGKVVIQGNSVGSGDGYATVQEDGVAENQRAILNFGNGLDSADNPGSARTDITLDPDYILPTRPSFSASQLSSASNVTGNGTVYTLGTTVDLTEDFDQGGDFNNTTGIFTAPVAGVYTFNTGVIMSSSLAGMQSITLMSVEIVTSTRTFIIAQIDGGATATLNADLTFSGSIIINLSQSDTAFVRCTASGTTQSISVVPGCYFSGALLH